MKTSINNDEGNNSTADQAVVLVKFHSLLLPEMVALVMVTGTTTLRNFITSKILVFWK